MDFVERFDAVQLRYAAAEFRRLVEIIARSVQSASTVFESQISPWQDLIPTDYIQPDTVIILLRTAILRLDPSSSCFTSNHLLFVRRCLEYREYNAALPILDKDIFYVPSFPNTDFIQVNPPFRCSSHDFSASFITTTSHLSEILDYTQHLKYFLYGAMIYIKLKIWGRALHFLEIVITCPTTNVASMIQVEAFKKWVLINLLANGQVSQMVSFLYEGSLNHGEKVPPMPRTTNALGAKTISALSRAYESIGQLFQEGISNDSSADRLIAEVEDGKEKWRDVSNKTSTRKRRYYMTELIYYW